VTIKFKINGYWNTAEFRLVQNLYLKYKIVWHKDKDFLRAN